MKPGLLSKEGTHIRASGNDLYTHNPLMPHGKGAQALAERQQKYGDGAQTIKNAIATEHGQALADRVFQNLNLTNQVTVGDLRAIRREIQAELQNQPTAQAQKSDLSGLSGEPHTDAHIVLRGGSPELDHASRAFREFLAANFEQPTMRFVDAYHDLLANPSKDGLQAFIRDHVDDPQMNIYDYSKDMMHEHVGTLGDHPSREEISKALGHVVGDVTESFGGDLYKRFRAEYLKS